MSAIEMQSLLSRLYVDEYCRHLFQYQPHLVLDKYRLTKAEVDALVSLDADRLDFYANILLEQRENRMKRRFPLLYTINAATESRIIEHLFRRYHSLHPETLEVGPEVEVQSFEAFIRQSVAGADDFPAYGGDIARYEAIRFLMSRHGSAGDSANTAARSETIKLDDVFAATPGTCVETFKYKVADIAAQLADKTLPTDVKEQTTTMVFQNQGGTLRTLAVSGPTAVLLRTLDGLRTVQEAVDSVQEAFGIPGLHESIIEVIHQLEKKNILARVAA